MNQMVEDDSGMAARVQGMPSSLHLGCSPPPLGQSEGEKKLLGF